MTLGAVAANAGRVKVVRPVRTAPSLCHRVVNFPGSYLAALRAVCSGKLLVANMTLPARAVVRGVQLSGGP